MVDNLSVKHVYDEIESLLQHVITDLDVQNIDFDNIKTAMKDNKKLALDTLDTIDQDIQRFKQALDGFVKSVEEPYYAKSQTVYQEGVNDSADYILDRHNFKKLLYQQETLDFFSGRIRDLGHWKWPAMEIRPAYGDISQHLTACDPLYLVDTDPELFKNVKKMWTPEYQTRVRYYTVKENEKRIFHQLPQHQFGLIVTVDFFNFRPLELIERYLKEMYLLLRPGGMVIFTYNNCDYPIGVDNFENSYYCYTPGRHVKAIAEKIGFRIASSVPEPSALSLLAVGLGGLAMMRRRLS